MSIKSLIYFYVLILLFISLEVKAESFTLQGKVTDDKGSPIELATVSVVSQAKATLTSLKGEYKLTLQSADSVVVRFSMIGYKTKTRVLRRPRGRQTLQITLHESDTTLGEVNVTGTKIQTGQTVELKKDDIKTAPSTTGNAVEEMIQTQAGVSTHNELSSQYNVRGGSFDENSVYINNTEIYRPFLVRSGQQEGLSIINADMVDKIGFSTGGYAVKYGDKMSSALDITYKKVQKNEGNISASLLGGSAYLGLGNKNVSWLNGFRYKTTRYFLGSLETTGEYRPNYLDYQTYFSYSPNERWQIDFIGNISDNRYNFTPKSRDTSFGTIQDVRSFRVYFDGQEKDLFRTFFGAFSLMRKFGNSASISLQLSAFHTKEKETYDIQGQYWLLDAQTNEELGIGTYFEHARNYLTANVKSVKLLFNKKTRQHELSTALTYKSERINESSSEYEMRDSAGYSVPHTGRDLHMIYSLRAKKSLDANRFEGYLQDTYRFTSKGEHTLFILNYGLRLAYWSFNEETIISPRISLGIVPAFNHNIVFRFATGLYYQAPFFKELRDTTTVNGTTYSDLNRKTKSQRSIHFITGMDYTFRVAERPFKFTTELYYKALSNIIPYSVNNMKVIYYGKNMASGHIAGIDFKLYGEFVPGTDSWISLSLMDAKMRLNGQNVSMPTDQRYSINIFFTDYFPGTNRWKMSLKMAIAGGLPFYAPHKDLETSKFRAPAYKRVDIGMSYRLLKKTWIGVDCLNLFGINNVNSYYWVTDVTSQQYAVPNYLTGRMLNAKVLFEF